MPWRVEDGRNANLPPAPDVQSRPDARPLTAKEMQECRGGGPYRVPQFTGVLPWQKSFRDINLCNGKLFKSFTDIQVAPARGAGLAWQRSYNSHEDRVGPFGVGWTHAYDIRMEEAGNNQVPRVDFFGGSHYYTRDADGLYTPPPYMFDELDSNYDLFLVNGPVSVLEDTQRGKGGSVKHFFANVDERACDWMEDRHGNRTTLTYGLTMSNGKKLLTRVTDPSGRYLDISWTNYGMVPAPIFRITQVAGPIDLGTSSPVYTNCEYGNRLLQLARCFVLPAAICSRACCERPGPSGVRDGPGCSLTIRSATGSLPAGAVR